MAFLTQWYFSNIPESVVDLIEKSVTEESQIPDTHWVGGFIWHYILRANRENWNYDLSHLDGDSVKFKKYEVGDYQTWHTDAKPLQGDEPLRKISFTIQLSNYDDYEGGNVEFMDETQRKYIIPRQRGTVALFDSSAQHRVCRVTKGIRKSLVGWCVGSQWR